MQIPPFIPVSPAPSYLADLNHIFRSKSGIWSFHPQTGYHCIVPEELAEPYCRVLNDLAGKRLATSQPADPVSGSNGFRANAKTIILNPEVLADTKVLDALKKDPSKINSAYGKWQSNALNLITAAGFPFNRSGLFR